MTPLQIYGHNLILLCYARLRHYMFLHTDYHYTFTNYMASYPAAKSQQTNRKGGVMEDIYQ